MNRSANKISVKKEIEKRYGVHVTSVNVVVKKAKPKQYRGIISRKSPSKKAIVTLHVGEKIEIA